MELTEELSALCLDTWLHLNQDPLTPLPNRWATKPSSLAFSAVLQCFVETACTKTLDLYALNQEEAAYLENLGISKAHIMGSLNQTIRHQSLDPLRFQLDALRHGSISAVCPFSGKMVTTSQSFLANINVVFYRFQSEQIFYLAVAGIGSGFPKSALYFPGSDLMVTGGDSWGVQPDDLLELKARMVTRARACYDYLTTDAPRKSAVCLGFYHFAHHLWNELSGVHRLQRSGLLECVDRFLVLREPLGPLEKVFPEIAPARIERMEDTSELFDEILQNGYFAVRVGEAYLKQDLAARVARVAAAHCNSETLAAVNRARSTCRPLVWVGIRVGNRSWADQADGLTQVIASLQKEFPRMGVVFDGFSLPGDKADDLSEQQGYSGILAQEQAIVSTITDQLRQQQVHTPIFNIIGHSIFDANVWAHVIDVYLSPHGSLQHKVGWFTNKYGIVHTNQTLLQNPVRYVWEAVEGGVPPRYISAAAVTDLTSGEGERVFYNEISDASETGAGTQAANQRVRENAEFMDYTIQWETLHQELRDLMRSPRTKPAMAALVMAHRVRRHARDAVRRLLRIFS